MRVVVVGIGALGSHALLACRSLPVEFVLVDHDRVESKNLLAQAHARASLGRNKAEAMRLQLLNHHGVTVEALPVRLEPTNVAAVTDDADLLVDCMDNQEGRRTISAHARSSGTPLVHAAISADGTFGLVRWDERFTADAEDEAGQATCEAGEHLPFIGLVAASLAGVIRDFAVDGRRRDLQIAGVQVTETWA